MSVFIETQAECDGWTDYKDRSGWTLKRISCENKSTSKAIFRLVGHIYGDTHSEYIFAPTEYEDNWYVKVGRVQCPECQKKEEESK